MTAATSQTDFPLTGDELVQMLAALANPQRLRILAALAPERDYVSRLARRIGMSRPLLHMHLRRLEAAGLVKGSLELSDDGRAMKYFEVNHFVISLSPATIARAVETLSVETSAGDSEPPEGRKTGGQ
jgi:DNA-binding transcriptional ArsR family regulator